MILMYERAVSPHPLSNCHHATGQTSAQLSHHVGARQLDLEVQSLLRHRLLQKPTLSLQKTLGGFPSKNPWNQSNDLGICTPKTARNEFFLRSCAVVDQLIISSMTKHQSNMGEIDLSGDNICDQDPSSHWSTRRTQEDTAIDRS